MVDEVAKAAATTWLCHKIMSDGLVLLSTVFLMQDQSDDFMRTCGDLIDSSDKDGTFHNRIIIGD
jgi:hypothetical protein